MLQCAEGTGRNLLSSQRWRLRTGLISLVLAVLAVVTGMGSALSIGASPASAASSAVESAISWAESHLGQEVYVGNCLQFVHDAYLDGAGVQIGSASTAVSYWKNHGTSQHPGDTNPPRGALVFWGATSSNSAGHVGTSLGNGEVISSYSYPKTTLNSLAVHEFSIAVRNAGGYPYLGWLAPPGVSLTGSTASSSGSSSASGPSGNQTTLAETTGSSARTWSNYSDAGGTQGATISARDTVQVTCAVQGFRVADGNTWWYRVASSPWNNAYYASADAFYNNGRTSGSLAGTPFVDTAVPVCVSSSSPAPAPTPAPAPAPTYAETVGGPTNTWTNYSNAGGTHGPTIAAYQTVQIACTVQGFRVADGNTAWYRIASSPWNNQYYASADAFYNNGATSGSLAGTPFVDPKIPSC